MTNFKAALNELSNAFTRDNPRKVYSLAEGSPEWMRDLIYAAHDGRMPDDWIYQAVYEIACNLNCYDDPDECRDAEHEICDGLVDVYTSDLTRWLGLHSSNVSLCDEAAEEFGLEAHNDIEHRIRMGQFLAYRRVLAAVVEGVESEADRRE